MLLVALLNNCIKYMKVVVEILFGLLTHGATFG